MVPRWASEFSSQRSIASFRNRQCRRATAVSACERTSNSTSLPAPPGPTDERFVYYFTYLTEEGRRVREEHDRANGKSTYRRTRRTEAVAAALDREARRERGQARMRETREAGLRSGTVCVRWRGRGRVPDLWLCGAWLREAGFDLGQGYEVEVKAERLTVQVV